MWMAWILVALLIPIAGLTVALMLYDDATQFFVNLRWALGLSLLVVAMAIALWTLQRTIVATAAATLQMQEESVRIEKNYF